MKKEIKELVELRIREAKETLEEARILLDSAKNRGAINRIYYAMFYATNALLLTKGFESSKHSGVISLFHREFVKTNIFPKDIAKFLDTAFDLRIAGDYGNSYIFEKKEIKDLLDKANIFIDKVKEILDQGNL